MRELKYRAWDKVEKKMLFDVDPFALHVSGSNEPLLAETHRNEDCIFEQYTELNDKNGKEIYEGDIVRYGGGNAYEVCFFNGCFGIKNRNLSVLYNSYTFNDNDIYGSNGKLRLEVIGNIHENPELVEKENK